MAYCPVMKLINQQLLLKVGDTPKLSVKYEKVSKVVFCLKEHKKLKIYTPQ